MSWKIKIQLTRLGKSPKQRTTINQKQFAVLNLFNSKLQFNSQKLNNKEKSANTPNNEKSNLSEAMELKNFSTTNKL